MNSRLILSIVSGLFLIAGCHDGRVRMYPASGKVVFTDGQPVRHGTVELESTEHGTSATGTIRDDGTFVLGTYTPTDGAAAGKHQAIVMQLIIADGTVKHIKDHGRPVDPKYGRYKTSGLTATVLPQQQNQLVLTLESKPNE